MAIYAPDGSALNLSSVINYQVPVGDNLVIDVSSGTEISSYVAGTLQVEGEPARRDVFALSFHQQDIPGVGYQRKVLGTTTSEADGTFHLEVGAFNDPVLVIAVDHYGTTWQPNTSYAVGDIVHPTSSDQYLGFVYHCTEAGISGADEPAWWVDTGSNDTGTSGTATFQAKQYFQPICHGPVIPVAQASNS
ncbi:hypothetical protein M3P05_12415 [Sansalvadorimonas sp. 2012CJ34-2]|uniref:Uncharacterized protein n=1 Tax=Parendozoicomonas callyspongiae TaxID=2942213 RepID=A0ABT0PHB4_9GAMM|nr:hypothetical protein [Sansalvadorimonas sp. 2012CJ34-2]MCL6270728.1 hypothetical protein [Sansalvadorimonas sp. 2012CJ34-2]